MSSMSPGGGEPSSMSLNEEILEGFGNYNKQESKDQYFAGSCYLKTKTDKFKEHWAELNGNEIFCYRDQKDPRYRVMHCLTGTFIKEIPAEKCPDTDQTFYPVKIVLPPNKSRILYFSSSELQAQWLKRLLVTTGYSSITDFYDVSTVLGKGQFGMVKLAVHKKSGKNVAIKTVKKSNMKPIEIF